jgi:cytochrome c2
MIKKVGLLISVLLYFSALIFLLGMRDSLPPWDFSINQWMVSAVFSAALTVALLVILLTRGVNEFAAKVKFSYLLVVTLSILVLSAIYFSNITISRVIVLYSLVFLAAVVFTFFLTRNTALHLLFSAMSLFFILSNYNYNWNNIGRDHSLKNTSEYAFSSYHDLKITSIEVKLNPDWKGSGGSSVVTTKIDFISPLELARYRESAPNPITWYRITDALFYPKLNRLFLTYTFWHPEKQCYTIRLSSVDFDLSTYQQKGDWSLLYESSPCLKLEYVNNESGARMAVLDSDRLIFTIGNFYYDRFDISKLAGSSYGKTYTLDLSSSELKVFTTGHRNSQGLLVDDDEIWSTEHGPFGGDELNLLNKGNDYGWPYKSYGTDYGKKVLTASNTVGDHSQSTRPIYAWLPSIGISNIVRYKGNEFPAWQDDLIIGSLRGLGNGYSLYRVRIREGRAVTVERINVGQTIREVAELPNGKLLLWSGTDVIQLVEQGENSFSLCSGCHAMRPLTNGEGPSLSGVVNGKVASAKRYNYSQAMTELGGRWTASRLDSFLKNPQAVVPGTTMDFPGIEDEATRKEIIKYMSDIQVKPDN